MALLFPRFLPTRTYPFSELRDLLTHQGGGLQEGVVGAGDLKVGQRVAGGANQSVDIAAGAAWVQGDDVTRQGIYDLVNDATLNQVVSAAHATLPRIDQVVARVYDSSVVGVSDTPAVEVIAGTPTAGATLDNRLGAAALPNGAVRLADVIVPAASTAVVTGNIRDRRPWCRGAHWQGIRAAGGNLTVAAATAVDVDATNLKQRIECSGAPLRAHLLGNISHSTADVNNPAFDLGVDAVAQGYAQVGEVSVVGGQMLVDIEWQITPAPGSHLIGPLWARLNSGTTTLIQGSVGAPFTSNPTFIVEEIVRQNAANT